MLHKCNTCKIVGPGPEGHINKYGVFSRKYLKLKEVCRQCNGELQPVSSPGADACVRDGYKRTGYVAKLA